ncbi:MAG: hypothetical protein HYS25_13200 [Ignavibacteriales bacterium]|nr:hypothetical protein [Ignavibacteriales bacterium]
MGYDFLKIREHITAVSKDTINHSQLTELVKISRLIIRSFIYNYRSNALKLLSNHGITLLDLSYDCIAEAFRRNQENKFFLIKKFISSLKEDIEDINETNLFRAYKSFLIKIASVQLSRLYSQYDPIGAKIIRNIKDAINEAALQKSEKFILKKELCGDILIVKECLPSEVVNEFPLERLEAEFSMDGKKLNVVNMLDQLYKILSEQAEYRKSVLLWDVVVLFKKYYGALYDNNFEINEDLLLSGIKTDGFEEVEIALLKQKIENFIKEKIFLDYLVKSKFNKEEAESVYSTITDIVSDLCSGVNTKETIYDYFSHHYQISKNDYLKNYKTRLEYLVKLVRSELSNYMLNET